jgi:hypothetical protein
MYRVLLKMHLVADLHTRPHRAEIMVANIVTRLKDERLGNMYLISDGCRDVFFTATRLALGSYLTGIGDISSTQIGWGVKVRSKL